MKRYFTSPTIPDPTTYQPRGQYGYLVLPGGGIICVLNEESSYPPSDGSWTELPHLLENVPAKFDGIQHVLGATLTVAQRSLAPLGGILPTDTTYQVAMKVNAVFPGFRP